MGHFVIALMMLAGFAFGMLCYELWRTWRDRKEHIRMSAKWEPKGGK